MMARVMLIVAALVLLDGCRQKPKPVKIPTPGRAAVIYNSAGDIIRDGGRCAPGTGGQSCTDKNGGQWICQPGSPCVRIDS